VTYPAFTRRRRLILIGGATLSAFLIILLKPDHKRPNPPSLSLVSMESSGRFEETGNEMWLVSFNIVNTNSFSQPDGYASRLYVKHNRKPPEFLVGGQWRTADGTSLLLGPREVVLLLFSGQQYEGQILVPRGADACRVGLKCATPIEQRSFKNVVGSLVSRLPANIQDRISPKFWSWVGSPRHGPSSQWREFNLQLPLHKSGSHDSDQ